MSLCHAVLGRDPVLKNQMAALEEERSVRYLPPPQYFKAWCFSFWSSHRWLPSAEVVAEALHCLEEHVVKIGFRKQGELVEISQKWVCFPKAGAGRCLAAQTSGLLGRTRSGGAHAGSRGKRQQKLIFLLGCGLSALL